ncbi:MAG TPA: DUF202 domain-containing protein [Candidatus Omnitrophica bacterium]|nr:DUF202 domain-containing protein [Candidatus Omnitrophota bacterium]
MNMEKSKNPQGLDVLRTHLANKRTFLAFVRTALTLVIAGLTFIQFFTMIPMRVLGGVFLFAGVIVFTAGWIQFYRTRRTIDSL